MKMTSSSFSSSTTLSRAVQRFTAVVYVMGAIIAAPLAAQQAQPATYTGFDGLEEFHCWGPIHLDLEL